MTWTFQLILLIFQVDAVRCSINKGVYAIKTISKIAAIRAGPVRQVT